MPHHTTTPQNETKICTQCGENKPLSAFGRDARAKSGLTGLCKECNAAKSKAYYKAHKEECKAKQRAHYEAHREERKASVAAYRAAEPEKRKVWNKTYNDTHRDEIKIYQNAWREANPERLAMILRNNRANRKGAVGLVSLSEWTALVDRYHGRCLCCGKVTDLTMDHVVPLSKGGMNDIGNVQPLCQSCNSAKFDRHIDYRMPEVGSDY